MPKRSRRTTQREVVVPDEPNWDPLQRAVEHWLCGQFMAMHEVELRNGAHVHCYKNRETRRSLHLDSDLDAYLFSYDHRRPSDSGRYERVSLEEAFGRVVLLPQFEDGWVARGGWDRAWDTCDYDDENGLLQAEDSYAPTGIELGIAEERWERLNLRLPDGPGGIALG